MSLVFSKKDKILASSIFFVFALTVIYFYATEKLTMIEILNGIVPEYDTYRKHTEFRGVKYNKLGACGTYNRHNQYNIPTIDLFFYGVFTDGKFKLISDGRLDDYMVTKCGEIGIIINKDQYHLGW